MRIPTVVITGTITASRKRIANPAASAPACWNALAHVRHAMFILNTIIVCVLVVESLRLFDEIHSVDRSDDCSDRRYYSHNIPEARILARTDSPAPYCNARKKESDYSNKENVKSAE